MIIDPKATFAGCPFVMIIAVGLDFGVVGVFVWSSDMLGGVTQNNVLF